MTNLRPTRQGLPTPPNGLSFVPGVLALSPKRSTRLGRPPTGSTRGVV
jgi:hypothetical protein